MLRGNAIFINYLPEYYPYKKIGCVYELSEEDFTAVKKINKEREVKDKFPLLSGVWYCPEKSRDTRVAICHQNIHSEHYKE